MVAVGDVFLGEHPVTLGHGVATIARKNGCEFLFEKVKHYLQDAHVVCANLEGIISPKLEGESGITSAAFWGDPTCAPVLRNVGFNCLFLANNHTIQHGKNALQRTCDLLDVNGIRWTGFNPAVPDQPLPAIFEINDLRIGFLAYCETQQYHLENQLLPHISPASVEAGVRKLREQCDVVVISLHWGDEFIDYPSPAQIKLARSIIDAGATMVLGHHSHTMQGMEHYGGGLIAYSLGSFIKDLWPRKLRESVILRCHVSKRGVSNVSLVPIRIDKKLHRPEPFEVKAGERFLARIETLSMNISTQGGDHNGQLTRKYLKDVKRDLLLDRIGTLFHYLFNIRKYDKRMLFENVKLILRRRIPGGRSR